MEDKEGADAMKSMMLPLLPEVNKEVEEAMILLAKGTKFSNVNSGESLFLFIQSTSHHPLPPSSALGYSLFFDDLLSRAEATTWFEEVLPSMANLVLRLTILLASHYHNPTTSTICPTTIRLLPPQHPGIVFLSQELIAALLACSFFCLFPYTRRDAHHLPPFINFNHLFQSLHDAYSESQEHKTRCILHYFTRISSCMPIGSVSFERKVLPFSSFSSSVSYPTPDFWSHSHLPLCHFEVCDSGSIEDQSSEALEVDFANKFLGGGALLRGCVQEEIRFMINPELISGILFLPCMEDNEAIEIIGAERFANYTGYASSFRFAGDHKDNRKCDDFKRLKTRIVAIDALCSPGMRQYKLKYVLRETNKAFCGFLDQSKCAHHGEPGKQVGEDLDGAPSTSSETGTKGDTVGQGFRNLSKKDSVGVATGNWGCGAFGGDPEIKAIIQWLAASQASRPFVLYYTFGSERLRNLDLVSRWITSQGWNIGELWNLLVEYSAQKYNRETTLGFLTWLLPSPVSHQSESRSTA